MQDHKLLAKPDAEWELGMFLQSNFAAMSAVADYVCWIGEQFIKSQDRRELFVEGMDRNHLQEHSLLIHMTEDTKEIPRLRLIPGVEGYLNPADIVDRDLISAIGIKGLDHT